MTEIDDLGSILWVEDPSAALPSPWEDDTYLEITRQIGHFNASWELNPPERKSWFLDDIVASKLEPRVHLLTSVGDYLDDALVQRALPPENVANLANLTKVMPSVFRLLNTGPRPLGHFDAQPQNLFPIRTEKGGIEAVAIDWASLGYAPLGLDAPLVIGSSLSWCEFDADHGKYLHPRALDSYLDGLGQMGWRGDTQLVRLAYMTGAVEHAAFYAMFPALWVDQPDWKTKFVDLMEKPPKTLVDQWRDAFASVYPLFESELASQGL